MQLYKIGEQGELINLDRLRFEETDVYLVDDEEKNTIYIWVGFSVDQTKKDITANIARKIDKERGGSAKILIMKEKREYGSFLSMMDSFKKGLIPGKSVERRPEFVFDTPPESIVSIGLDGTLEKREDSPETKIRNWLQQIHNYRGPWSDVEEEKPAQAASFVRLDTKPEGVEIKEDVELEKESYIEEDIEQDEESDFKTEIREAAYYLSLKKYSYDELCWILAEKIQKMSLKMPSIEDIKRKAEDVFRSSCSYDELCWLNAEMDHLIKKNYLD
ncbi:MAG: hypothetical protein ACXADU_02880 [Promethearchaeota archaeon]|jgi:hypothetical protein